MQHCRARRGRLFTTTALPALMLALPLLAGGALLAPGTASAQTEWLGTASDDWFTPGNWTNGVPAAANVQVTIDTVVPNPVVIAGGAALSGTAYIGASAGTTGAVTVSGAGAEWSHFWLHIGSEGSGTLRVEGGAVVETRASADMGSGGDGTATVTGGGSRWSVSQAMFIGVSSVGTLTVADGGAVSAASTAYLGLGNNGIGTATVTGAGSEWTMRELAVGHNGVGTLTIADGGVVASEFESYIGSFSAGAVGTATVTGAGSTWTSNLLTVGRLGTGTLTVADGGLVAADTAVHLGRLALSSGTLTLGAAESDAPQAPGVITTPRITFGEGAATLVFNHTAPAATAYAFGTDLQSIGTGTHAVRHLAGVTHYTGDASAFAGMTMVSGGTLRVDGSLGGTVLVDGGTLGGAGTLLGDVTIANGGILAPGNSIGELTVAGNLMLNPTSQLHFEIGAPGTAADPASGSSDRIAVGGDLTLDGQLHLTDAGGGGIGHYRLMTYGGVLTDNTLDVVTPGPIAGGAYTVTAGGGNVDLVISGTVIPPETGDPNLQYWQGAGGTWDAAALRWRNDGGEVDVAWAGNHGVFNGTGSTILVDGTQSFRGFQFVTDGYVLAGTGALQTVAGGSELRVLAGETATIATGITGAGGIAKTQGGTLILTGVNSYSGATVLEAGTLALQGSGDIAASAALSFTGAGTFDVSGVASGNTQIGTLSGVGGSQIVLGATDLAVTQATSQTFAGVISGSGGVALSGPGVLTFTGANTYDGLTEIAAGATLRLGDGGTGGSVAGDIRNDGTLVFNRSDSFTYEGVLTGGGNLFHRGTGTTILTGDNSLYGGAVGIEAGTLRLAPGASLASSLVTVGTDGTLAGIGNIGGDILVQGRLAPGGEGTTLGRLFVNGNVTFQPGAVYAVRIAGTNGGGPVSNDQLVAGSFDLAGSVVVTAIDPRTSYVDGHSYLILSTDGGTPINGTFDGGATMAGDSAFITPTLSYTTGDVFLTIGVTHDFTTVAETFNQRQAAGALFGLDQTAGSDALAAFNTIAAMNADDARRAFDLSSGEVHASGQHVIDQTFALFNRTLRYQGLGGLGAGHVGADVFTAPLGYGPAVSRGNAGVAAIDATGYADARVRGAWAAPLGGFGRIDGDGNAGRLEWWNGGLAGGYEGVVDLGSGNAVAGLGFGYIRSHGSIDDRLSTFDSDGFYLGAYGAWADGPWTVAGSLSYGANRVSTERNIAFMGQTAAADYWTHSVGLTGEVSYAFDIADTTRLAPLFTLDAGWSGHGGFTETGAGALNLSSGSESWTRFDAGLGLALTHTILTDSGRVTLEGRAVWERAFSDVVPSQALTLAGSPVGFSVRGPGADRDRLRLGAGLAWDISDNMTVRARYDGLFSGDQNNHTASFGLNIRF